jgi:hypothetical protein
MLLASLLLHHALAAAPLLRDAPVCWLRLAALPRGPTDSYWSSLCTPAASATVSLLDCVVFALAVC